MAFNNIIIKGFKKSFKLITQGYGRIISLGEFVKICSLRDEPNVGQHLSTELNVCQKISIELNVGQHLSTVLNVGQHINDEPNVGQHLSTESGL